MNRQSIIALALLPIVAASCKSHRNIATQVSAESAFAGSATHAADTTTYARRLESLRLSSAQIDSVEARIIHDTIFIKAHGVKAKTSASTSDHAFAARASESHTVAADLRSATDSASLQSATKAPGVSVPSTKGESSHTSPYASFLLFLITISLIFLYFKFHKK